MTNLLLTPRQCTNALRGLASTLAIALAVPLGHARAGEPPDTEIPSLCLGGFSWLENLDFDGEGALFVSDSKEGTIWRITFSGTEWEKEALASSFKKAYGLAAQPPYLYASVTTRANEHRIIRLSLEDTGGVETRNIESIATLPHFGNGLEFGPGGFLYATTGGNFLPGSGAVYRIDPETQTWSEFLGGLWGADGIAIDGPGQTLYVGQVTNSRVLVIDLNTAEVLDKIRVPGIFCYLDDIALDAEGTCLYGALFGKDAIVRIELKTRNAVRIYKGLDGPTSLLLGEGPDFNPTSLYVTEGGGFLDRDQAQRILEIPLAETNTPPRGDP